MLPVVFVAVGLGAAVLASANNQKTAEAWAAAARELGIQHRPPTLFQSPAINGPYGNIGVSIDTFTENKATFTRYVITHRAAGPPVRMTREGVAAPFFKLFNITDVEVGVPRFDDQVKVKSAYPDQVRSFLTPSRQAAVLAIFGEWQQATITHNSIQVVRRGVEVQSQVLVWNVQRLASMAEVLGDSAGVDRALQMQQAGDLGDAIDAWHEVNESSENSFSRALEAEALAEHGDHRHAAEVLPDVPGPDADTPYAQELEGWHEVVEAAAPELLPLPTSNAAVSNLDQQQVMDDLFDGKRMSFEIVSRFEELYVNARVGWTGTVTQSHSYRHDNDFGDGPGIKATVLLGNAGSETVLSNEVHAVLQLPEGAEIRRGQELVFEGTLQFVDRFARKLYLASGTLT